MKDKQYCVYKHVSPNGKIYIGQTCQKPEKRWQNGHGYKAHHHFYNAIQKYGWDNFEHVIIADGLTKKEADYLEKYLIAYYETMNPLKGFNHTRGGEGITGHIMSDETKRKISEAKLGHKKGAMSEETRRKMSEAKKGSVHSEETKHKISEAIKGRERGAMSEETKRKISESHKGVKMGAPSEETRRKISESIKLRWELKKQLQKSA